MSRIRAICKSNVKIESRGIRHTCVVVVESESKSGRERSSGV